MRSKIGISEIEVSKKFSSEEEAKRYAKNLREYIRYICKKNADLGYLAQAMIVVSNIRGNVGIVSYESNGKKGRPKKVINISEFNKNYYKDNINVDWHIHILVVSRPLYAFRDLIKDYIDRNWNKDIGNDIRCAKSGKNGEIRAYKKDCNINMAQYFINQGKNIIFCNYNYSNEIGLIYSLKEYYNEYMKVDSKKRKFYEKVINNNISKEKQIKELNKIESKFKEIENYYYSFSKDKDNKKQKEYMNNIKYSKIKENYNKVQKIKRNIIKESSYF